MNVEFSKSFDKQTSRITDKILLKRISNIIRKVIECDSLNKIPNLKPIVGHQGFYRIRLGDYRMGISLEEETVMNLTIKNSHKSPFSQYSILII